MSDDKPGFGYGAGPAEVIRAVLRKAGRREFSERHGGLVVAGGGDGRPFQVACADDAEVPAQELARYSGALLKAGYRVEPDPDDDEVLLVREAVLFTSGVPVVLGKFSTDMQVGAPVRAFEHSLEDGLLTCISVVSCAVTTVTSRNRQWWCRSDDRGSARPWRWGVISSIWGWLPG
ncbi:hypothetical protein [Streptosporangium sp. NPDC000396]|uniref:hypothetical protein n=1 Tax=Streptosporangium sp. NPDC000396 TaxID=3366185 RepID=UPI0036C0A120